MISIADTVALNASAAKAKSEALRAPVRFTVSGVLAGAYIGFAVVLMVCAAGPLLSAGDGWAKLISGLVFGVALTLVILAGAELVTSSMMVLTQGVLARSVTVGSALVVLLASFCANLVGSVLFAALVVLSGVLRSNPDAGEMLSGLLAAKANEEPLQLLIRGILCNVLVCLAVWMSSRVQSEVAKVAVIYVALMTFITSGFEHVVANMTSYSLGFLLGDPHATMPLFLTNMLWVGLGNLIGGSLIVGAGYWFVSGSRSRDCIEASSRS